VKQPARSCLEHGPSAVKRSPDGQDQEYQSKVLCSGASRRGLDTYSPLVSWSTVRFLLVFALTFGWHTASIDFSAAFVQATLKEPVWIHLPQASVLRKGLTPVFVSVRSLYGLSVSSPLVGRAPKGELLAIGLKQSSMDYCLFYDEDLLVGTYCDDLIIVGRPKQRSRSSCSGDF
jgi:hypothetical protein